MGAIPVRSLIFIRSVVLLTPKEAESVPRFLTLRHADQALRRLDVPHVWMMHMNKRPLSGAAMVLLQVVAQFSTYYIPWMA